MHESEAWILMPQNEFFLNFDVLLPTSTSRLSECRTFALAIRNMIREVNILTRVFIYLMFHFLNLFIMSKSYAVFGKLLTS